VSKIKVRILLWAFGFAQVGDGLMTILSLGFARTYLALNVARMISRARWLSEEELQKKYGG